MQMVNKKEISEELIFKKSLTEIEEDLQFVLSKQKTNKKTSLKLPRQYAQLTDKLINATGNYLSVSANNRKKSEVAEKFIKLSEEIFSQAWGKKIEEYRKDRQIACFIQALLLCGSGSRKKTISFVSKWLDMKLSTTRTIHETYREQEKKKFDISDYKKFIRLVWVELDDFLETHSDFEDRARSLSEFNKQKLVDTEKLLSAYKKITECLNSAENLSSYSLSFNQKNHRQKKSA